MKIELLKEIQTIKQDADAIVANYGKGFFSSYNAIDITQNQLDLLLP